MDLEVDANFAAATILLSYFRSTTRHYYFIATVAGLCCLAILTISVCLKYNFSNIHVDALFLIFI